MYICNKSTATDLMCLSLFDKYQEPGQYFTSRYKVESYLYINGNFTLCYTGAMTIATKLRQKGAKTRNFK